MQRAGAVADGRIFHVQHHPIAAAAGRLARAVGDAPRIACTQRVVAHVADGGGVDGDVHIQPRLAQGRCRLDRLAHVVFDGGRVGHVFAQVEQGRADAMRFAQPDRGAHGLVDVGSADEAPRQRGPGGQAAHGPADARAARQRDGGFLE